MKKKHEYQQLDSADYTKRPLTRIVLGILLLVQMLMLMLWAITLIERSKNNGSYLDAEKSTFEPENVVIESEIFENYQRESPIWETTDPDTNQDTNTGKAVSGCSVSRDAEKFDCHPEDGGNLESCTKRRCCWERVEVPGVPWCYFPKNYGGYETVNASYVENGAIIFLSRTFPSPHPEDVKLLRVDMKTRGKDIIHLKIVDAESRRYEPPYPEIPLVPESNSKESPLPFYISQNGFKVLHRGQVLFDIEEGPPLIYANQFLQITIPFSGKIYGLGEHHTSLELDTNWTKYTLFNRDGIPEPGKNLYGSHPFFLSMTPDGTSRGVFFHNSNAMDIVLQPLPAVTYRTIGGIIDLHFFTGPTPSDVIKQYTALIGRPFLPPYWSLGFHLSRFGLKTTYDLKKLWTRTRLARIPVDAMWSDIDYMDKRNDFTLDQANYRYLPGFVHELHKWGVHYVPILDPGISGCEPKGTYHPYDEGVQMDVFVKHDNGSIFVGKVWNRNCTVFPDFTSKATHSYWSDMIQKFHRLLNFDGLWLDMNEPSNFVDGSFDSCPPSKWDNPHYIPNVVGGKLWHLTLCMSARHVAGLHYDIHNVYGLAEAVATHSALKELGKRPFVISRSSYPGIGKYAGHWSGDVTSSWESMKATIPKMLSFSLFGVPMMGADICGFNGNTTVLLCQRWSQLGAFYPFSRNHNSDDCIDQDPVALGGEVIKSAQKALLTRYTLLPYLYTLFFKAHTQGETVARPLFFEFSSDPRTHSLQESFLWGCCVLIVPVLNETATTVKTYLPAARWYDWYTGLGLETSGKETVLSAPSDTIPVLIRGGVIIPTQIPGSTTTQSRKNYIELIAACNTSLDASGSLYWDDGLSLGTAACLSTDAHMTGHYGLVNFTLTPNNLTSTVSHWGCHKGPRVHTIKILGFVKPISKVQFNKKAVPFNWNTTSLVLTVRVRHSIRKPFTLEWSDFKQ